MVIGIAEDPSLFTYLRDTSATVELVVGDGRIALGERAVSYDLLLIDAFSSDAIPVHLMTLEAVEGYMSSVRSDGILLLHVSNRFFDLEPVVGRIAAELGLESRTNAFSADRDAVRRRGVELDLGCSRSRRGVVRRLRRQLDTQSGRTQSLWTDDHSNVLGARW